MHPGEYLAVSYVEPYELSQRELAERLGVSTAAVSRLLAGKADLSPEMAVRLALVFDRSAESWMELQSAHSLALAKKAVDPATTSRFEFAKKAA
jgi:addiction module HigA family antidote